MTWDQIVSVRRDAVRHSWLLRVEVTHPHLAPSRQWSMARRLEREHRPPAPRCGHGHRYTPGNTYLAPDGERQCRICRHAASQRVEAARATPTLPVAPLAELVARRYDMPSVGCRPLAEACGVSRERALGWLTGMRLSIDDADKAAVALGEHPSAIWDDWFQLALMETA